MRTNEIEFGADIPGLNILPESLRLWLLIILVLSPYLTRAFYAIKNGGGLKGIAMAIWLGTNVPNNKPKQNETTD